jgi:hypothetical protein
MQETKLHTIVDHYVLKTLLYFDIFQYPLKSEEVYRFLGTNNVSQNDVMNSLNALSEQNFLFQFGEFYSIQNNEILLQRRLKGNEEAKKYLPLAKKIAGLIARFPFVRGVLASGSLSKNYMDEHSDLDFFIVTSTGRLWIARTLLVMYKRLFLFNSHKYFCVNYFVDESHLEIEEKNQFTATELATLIPLYNGHLYRQLIAANGWVKKFFPNMEMRTTDAANEKVSPFKKNLERFIGITWIENFFMAVTLKRWKSIYQKKYQEADFRIAFKTGKHVSKNHPNHYQRKVMLLFQQKLNEFNSSHNITLQ